MPATISDHHPLQGAHGERQVQADAADPRVDLDERLAVVDGGALRGDPRRTGQRHQRDGQEGASAGTEQQPWRHDRRRQQSGDQQQHKRWSSSLGGVFSTVQAQNASSGRSKGCRGKMGDGPHPGDHTGVVPRSALSDIMSVIGDIDVRGSAREALSMAFARHSRPHRGNRARPGRAVVPRSSGS